MAYTPSPDEMTGQALALAHDAWLELSNSSFVAAQSGKPLSRLPKISLEEAERRSKVGRDILERASRIDLAAIPHDVALTIKVAIDRASIWAREAEWYWLVFDPMGVGFFALFAPTPYGGGFVLGGLVKSFMEFPFQAAGDTDRYLALISDYAALLHQMRERTEGQAKRGIVMPKAQLAQAPGLLKGLKAQALSALLPSAERLGPDADGIRARIEQRLAEQVAPAYDAFLALVESADYQAKAPDAVGIGQYLGGAAVYEELVRQHTTMDLTPREVHAKGQARMQEVWSQISDLLSQVGFAGDAKAYLAAAAENPRWRADTPEAIRAVFQKYVDRLKPKLDASFHRQAQTPYSAEPLPAALSGSMTFGYYDAPTPAKMQGRYLFNAQNLSKNDLCGIASLTYHELAPGHHTHLARQLEAPHLHPLRKAGFCNAYNEGWAEYAATLAGELGAYEEPEERFGRLMMDTFLTSRLVVDTGMNALGWSLEQARDYMREFTFMPEQEISTETVRYSCDIPGQSLAYKLGDTRMMELREEMRATLGNRFDIRDFHEAVLGPGALPLPVLADHVRHETRRLESAEPAS